RSVDTGGCTSPGGGTLCWYAVEGGAKKSSGAPVSTPLRTRSVLVAPTAKDHQPSATEQRAAGGLGDDGTGDDNAVEVSGSVSSCERNAECWIDIIGDVVGDGGRIPTVAIAAGLVDIDAGADDVEFPGVGKDGERGCDWARAIPLIFGIGSVRTGGD